jgi:SAM-dependent methyltransferase
VESGPALEAVRRRLAAGEPLAGDLLVALSAAATAADPAATEDTLAALSGNGGVHLHRSLVGWAALVARERVLDVGCGAGGTARAAAEAVGEGGFVVAVDRCPEAVEEARRRTPDDLVVLHRVADVARLEAVPDRGMDCVVASLLLDQLPDLGPALRELHRVLRPGGRLVASVMDFDQFRPADAAFMGAPLAVVARHAPGAFAGRGSRATIPRERADAAAFREAGFSSVEERDVQLVAPFETPEAAWALFGRSLMARMLGEEGRAELRAALAARVPHTLYLPVRFLRTRRPG